MVEASCSAAIYGSPPVRFDLLNDGFVILAPEQGFSNSFLCRASIIGLLAPAAFRDDGVNLLKLCLDGAFDGQFFTER
ncbi:hypothetical protein ELZ22_17460 [Brucella abortus]|nr:hypothetical protein ELZ22_17460 [Brucella abortus]RUQ96384.1 hypothetical protein ELZ21_15770 [Brucella abortus]